MDAVLILTISGRDRAGLVERLAEVVAAHDGNWEHSRMAHLADRFAGLLQVTVPEAHKPALREALDAIEELDVTVVEGRVQAQPERRSFGLEIVGGDHPGIVRDIFKGVVDAGANVEELSTRTGTAPESGGRIFEAQARLACPEDTDLARVRRNLEAIAEDVMVDVTVVE